MLLAYSRIYIRLSQTPLFVAYYARREYLIHLARAKCVGAGAVSYAQLCRLQAQGTDFSELAVNTLDQLAWLVIQVERPSGELS